MTSRHAQQIHLPHVGGKSAVILFIFTLLAFVAESQLTQYVQVDLGYQQPFFLFYIVHSSFFIIFPLHILFLYISTGTSIRPLIKGLDVAIRMHFVSAQQKSLSAVSHTPFPTFRLSRLVLYLTIGVTCPGLLWFAATALAPISDVTAIWNTNAFFAYIFTVKLFKLNWETRKLVAVLLATVGVMAVIYGGSQQPAEPEVRTGVTDDIAHVDRRAFRTAFIGDALTLAAAIGYGLYQVFYKRYAALPFDPEFEAASDTYEHLFITDDELSDEPEDTAQDPMAEAEANTIYPPPFGLHPNLLTSAIGFCTIISLWIFIPILHYLDVEIFRLPPNAHTVLTIAAIAGSGVIFNAGFMVLLGIWGPIITSVGNLLTIVLVFLSDVVFGKAADVVTIWSVIGAGGIVLAFGILAYDMLQHR